MTTNKSLKTEQRVKAVKVATPLKEPINVTEQQPPDAALVLRRRTLTEHLDAFVQAFFEVCEDDEEKGLEKKYSYGDRQVATMQIESSLDATRSGRNFQHWISGDGAPPAPNTLDFSGKCMHACMGMPFKLIELVNELADLYHNPIETVLLPSGLESVPSWLGALPQLKRLEISEYAGRVMDLQKHLPYGAVVAVFAPTHPDVKVVTDPNRTIEVNVVPRERSFEEFCLTVPATWTPGDQ
jgi:hypothetical protein